MSWRIENSDALSLLRSLPCEWAQTCVTSPPYRGPQDHVEHLVSVLDEVHRVLRSDGTLWLNLGDSYTSTGRSCGTADPMLPRRERSLPGPGPKDLVGVPWRVAFALKERGWWLRSYVIWVRPNPMPETVHDRPTRPHEYLFLLTKQPYYFYDATAFREPATNPCPNNRYEQRGRLVYLNRRGERAQHEQWRAGNDRKRRSWWKTTGHGNSRARLVCKEKLVERCVLAGSAPTACGICGAPWQRKRTTPNGQEGLWGPSCGHQNDIGRCLVLDPFCGSATTGTVAHRLGRNFLGIEPDRATATLARRRLQAIAPEAKR